MAASSTAFTVLKWVGAAYLFYVGVKLVLSKAPPPVELIAEKPIQTSAEALKSIFFRGFLTNVLNPKVALFFLAFVPQFIAPDASHPALTFVLLGVLFNVNAVPINMGYALLAAWATRRMGAVQRAMHWLDRLAGVMFVGFGMKLALTEAPQP